MCDLLLRALSAKQFGYSILRRYYSLSRQNHYDVLRLQKNCSDKDIKDAFVKLSKEFHPDRNKTHEAQERFVAIVEAYNVLGKPLKRAKYDNLSTVERHTYPSYSQQKQHQQYYSSGYPQYAHTQWNFHQQRRQQAKNEKDTYYSGYGVNRIPKYVLILLCIGIATIGAVLQGYVVREMYMVQKREALERSVRLAEELEEMRAAAAASTNEMQTRKLMEKIVESANPTIATATLGQALATADKE